MFFIDYNLAKQITEERRAQARAHALRRQARSSPPPARSRDAEVVGLVFGAQCECERIGA